MRLHHYFVPAILLAIVGTIRAEESRPDDGNIIRVAVDAAKPGPPINPFIYGQFIEHLGRCIYGGIWAEMLEDRKFYYPITDKYQPYGEQKGTKFPVVSASPWQVIGPAGSVTMVKENAFVGEHSPQIAAGSGIQQNDLGLIERLEYVGHVRVRAPSGKSELEVSLVSGDGEENRDVNLMHVKTNDYEEHRIGLRALRTTEHGRLVIKVTGGPCVIGTISLMPADNVRGFRADTLALLKQLHATIYRWPGGNFVSGYDWRDGIGPRDRRPPRKNPAWSGVEHNDVGLDEFLDLCHEIGAEPMIAVNSGFGDDYSAAQEVEYANGSDRSIGGSWRVENGHADPYRVKYWCIGNEMWGPWQLGHMELSQYTQKHNRFAAAMRKVDPKLIFVGSGDFGSKAELGGKDKREVSWSEGMLEQCAGAMDFISEHFYKGRTPWGEKTPDEIPAYVSLLKDEIRKKSARHRELQTKLGRSPDHFVPIAMDEWNYWHHGYVYGELGCQYTLADALGVAAGLHEYFRNSDIVHMANYAQTVNVIGCIKTTKTAAFLDTTALPLLLYRREFGEVPLAVSGNYEKHSLDVVAARTRDGSALTVGIVNPQSTPQTVHVHVAGMKLHTAANVWRIAGNDPEAINTVEKQKVTIVEEKNIPFGDQLKVPPYSISVYRAPIK